ncbi:MAG TPA: ABC transporter substrate-binding protein [Chloroflexota bacterium]|nr:ABC transporter substrate-binding protein [Chloroflexota bacterium]
MVRLLVRVAWLYWCLVAAACTGTAAPVSSPATGAPASAPPTPSTSPLAASAAAPARAAVKVGVTPLLTVSGLYVALERGYFQEQGLDVTTENISDPTNMVPSLATGQIDVGNGALSAGLWNAIARGADVRLVALQSSVRPGLPGSAYIVRKQDLDSGVFTDFASLRGKRVSINGRGNFTHIVLVKALEQGGLTQADVDLVDMGQPDAAVALANGSIDVATLSEPIRTGVLAQGFAAVWKDFSEIYPGQQATAWVYSPQFARERPDAGRRFMVALLQGIRDLYDAFNKDIGRDSILDILTKYLSVRDRALYATMRLGVDPNGEFDVELLQNDVDWYVAYGFSPQRVDVTRAIDRQFVDYALQQLGRYQP